MAGGVEQGGPSEEDLRIRTEAGETEDRFHNIESAHSMAIGTERAQANYDRIIEDVRSSISSIEKQIESLNSSGEKATARALQLELNRMERELRGFVEEAKEVMRIQKKE